MNKPIPTAVHGVLDYVSAAGFVVVPHLFGATKIGQRVMYGFAAATVLSSALTKYEEGIWRVLPVKAHLVLDAVSGMLLCGAAFSHKRASSRAMLIGMGLTEIALAALTTTTSPLEAAEQRPWFALPQKLRSLVTSR